MKDVMTPAAPDEIRFVIKKCLENAAMVNYTEVTEKSKIEGIFLNGLFILIFFCSLFFSLSMNLKVSSMY